MDPSILDILARAEDRYVIPKLRKNLTFKKETTGPGFPSTLTGFVVRPVFKHTTKLTRNGQAAISLTHYREFLDSKPILSDALKALKIKNVSYDDELAIAELILKIDSDNKTAQKIVQKRFTGYSVTRFQACLTCARLGRHATFATKSLSQLKTDYYPEVRRAALRAIQRIDDDTP